MRGMKCLRKRMVVIRLRLACFSHKLMPAEQLALTSLIDLLSDTFSRTIIYNTEN